MANRPLPSPEELRQLLRYEPETGKLFWKASLSNRAPAGAEAFSIHHASDRLTYRRGKICGHRVYAHRVIWTIVHGYWPKGDIDHINGDPSDNRLANLREATRSQNNMNTGLRRDNVSGVRGVTWCENSRRWNARIRNRHIGSFATREEAASAYEAVAIREYGAFVRAS
ncbi:HNH endonuclease [Sphingopyxis indica]|uniref:HNH endonuclease n=1 Tax=Sphingopyxis indica TaxID=436663 RepID=UPI00148249EA|nr:HNH endonuclease [Sphingopyxis indica]